jgi:hypothetical protein
MLSIESWKLCDQLIEYQLSKTRSALRNPLLSVISITFTYISVRKRCKETKSENFIERIKRVSSIENFQKQQSITYQNTLLCGVVFTAAEQLVGSFIKANTVGLATQASAT